MADSLQILTYRHSAQPRHRFNNIQSQHTNNFPFINQKERMIAGCGIVRMILNITLALSAILKQHLAPYRMKRAPLLLIPRTPQFVFVHRENLRNKSASSAVLCENRSARNPVSAKREDNETTFSQTPK